jgi:hypothetical protein
VTKSTCEDQSCTRNASLKNDYSNVAMVFHESIITVGWIKNYPNTNARNTAAWATAGVLVQESQWDKDSIQADQAGSRWGKSENNRGILDTDKVRPVRAVSSKHNTESLVEERSLVGRIAQYEWCIHQWHWIWVCMLPTYTQSSVACAYKLAYLINVGYQPGASNDQDKWSDCRS